MISGAFDSLSHVMETYFSAPDERNVSDEISETLMQSIIRNIRMILKDPQDYGARSNLLWESSLSENRLIKLGKQCDFACHLMAHQIGAYTDCSHGQAMAVLHPVITGIYTETVLKNFQDLPGMCGKSGNKGKQMRSWQKTGSMHLNLSSK